MAPPGAAEPVAGADGRRLRGDQTRARILARAVDVASAEGLGGVSLARLGADLGLSKSGVNGHFASREHLQLAVIGVAARLYQDRVVVPALQAPPGLPRLWTMSKRWLEFMRSGELSGRSFFLTALVEYDARPGPVRDELVRLRRQWEQLFTGLLSEAQHRGHVVADVDAAQVFFEVAAAISAAVLDAQLLDDPGVFDRADASLLARFAPLVTHRDLLGALRGD